MEISDNAKGETPKKPAKRGPKPKGESPNDICRLCCTHLKLKFGDFQKTTYVATENLFKPSKREGCYDTLAELCSSIGLNVLKSTNLSERVCQACARKIRNAVQLYSFLASSLTRNAELSQTSRHSSGDSPRRVKRLLPSSVSSPERSPQPKKGHKKNSTVKKSLNFVAETSLPNKENEEPSNVELITNQGRDIPLLAEIELNVEDLYSLMRSFQQFGLRLSSSRAK